MMGNRSKGDEESCSWLGAAIVERVMGLEPTNGSLGSYCLTAWQHPPTVMGILI